MRDHDFVLATGIAGGERDPHTHTMLTDRLAPQASMLYHAWFSRRSKNSDNGVARDVLTLVGTAIA